MNSLSFEEMSVTLGGLSAHKVCVAGMAACGIIGDVVLGAASLGIGAAVWSIGWSLFADEVCSTV